MMLRIVFFGLLLGVLLLMSADFDKKAEKAPRERETLSRQEADFLIYRLEKGMNDE